MKRIVCLILTLISINSYCSLPVQLIENEIELKDISLEFCVFEDTSGILDISQIIEKPELFTKGDEWSYGHTSSAVWYKVTIHNKQTDKVYLVLSPAWTPSFEFYQIKHGIIQSHKIGGTMAPFANRDLLSNRHGLKVDLGKKDYYFKIKGDHPISPHFQVGTEAQIIYQDRIHDHFHFFYFGLIFFLLCYNTFLSISSRRVSFIYYTLCVLSMLLGMSFIKGLVNEFFDLPWLSNSSNIFTSSMVIFLMLSVGKFTKTEERFPFLNFLKKIIIIVAIASLAVNIIGFTRFANSIILNIVFIGGLWGLVVGFTMLKDRKTSSTLIFLGYAAFIFGGITHICVIRGLLPYNLFTHNAYMIGSGIEVVFHSFAFGVNLNVLRKERYLAQKEALKEAEKNTILISEQNKVLETKVTERTAKLNEAYGKLQSTLDTVHNQKTVIEQKNEHITDSIVYAKRIQDALLPTKELPNKYGLDLAILYKPKDIISGDFYWFGEVDNTLIMVVADCTGHGVPGAMLSISGHNLLNRIVLEKNNPDLSSILSNLHLELTKLMRCDITETQDGMDVQIVSYSTGTDSLKFAGANNPIYVISEQNELKKIRGNRTCIGGTSHSNPQFDTIDIPTWKNIFLCSDGYQDQFSEGDKKFMIGRLKKTFIEVSPLPVNHQEENLKSILEDWQGTEDQTDDILVVGFRRKNST